MCKGQGAGIAAAVGIKTGKNTHDVAIDDVQAELKKQNVKFKWNKRENLKSEDHQKKSLFIGLS